MFQQSLPGVAQAADDARAWIRDVVQSNHLGVPSDLAVRVAGDLVRSAVRHTPAGDEIHICAIPAQRGGLRIEVRDPGAPATGPYVGAAWADISREIRDFGARNTSDGHVTWVEIPESAR